ncbi:MAG: amidohydrolase [Rhodospirillales bacterium]|nr:amidohydrolase [Rhodospirillales bacterium]
MTMLSIVKAGTIGAAALALLPGAALAALDVGAVKPKIESTVAAAYPHLDALYKDIHEHPELGFMEVETAAKLAKEMRGLGFEVTEKIGKTGLVAILKNGPGPTVMVRTELDALPMEEKTGLPYASKAKATWNGAQTFVAHSCGHDIHMASWVGTATILLAMKDRWHGTLMFVAQPSEETVTGAQAMLDDGLYTRFGKPDFAFALHDGPPPTGTVAYRAGVLTSNGGLFEITFKGRGGHGASPNLTIDPVVIASHFVVDLQSVVSREKDPSQFGVITVGAIQGGSAGNIVPDSVLLRGTIRSFDLGVHAKLVEGLRRTAKAAAEMAGAPEPAIEIQDPTKSVINDQPLFDRTVPVFQSAFGDKAGPAPLTFASEDFSAFEQPGIQSFFFTIGAYDPKRIAAAKAEGKVVPPNHLPYFEPMPEPTIKTGVEAMTLAVLNVMGDPAK